MPNRWLLLIGCILLMPKMASGEHLHSPFRDAMAKAAIHAPGTGQANPTIRRHKPKGGRQPDAGRAAQAPGYRKKPGLPSIPGHRPGRLNRPPKHRPPRHWWPTTTTIVKEAPTIIIVETPPPAPPAPPKPKEIWVPPVISTRTEPGYWDYGVQKVWMGDHWRYEQDITRKTWVPASQVPYVLQNGYWKVVE